MKIAIIGGGNMGGAIARGLLTTSFIEPSDLNIVDPASAVLAGFQKLGASTHIYSGEWLTQMDVVIIAVKPWLFDGVSSNVASYIKFKSSVAVATVAAGITLDRMRSHFIENQIFCVMPNTAVTVGQGMIFISTAEGGETCRIEPIFEQLGRVMVIPESQMMATMALASCGIAYAMRYARAAMEGGVELGIAPSMGQEIVAQTLRGAADLLMQEGSHPEVEIDKVTTPGGITIRGLNAMEQYGFTNAVIQGLKASK